MTTKKCRFCGLVFNCEDCAFTLCPVCETLLDGTPEQTEEGTNDKV